MKCINHPDKEQAATCVLCNESLCEDCLVVLGEHSYCKKCLTEKISGGGNSITKSPSIRGNKSRFWAFVLSLVPGLGYLYLGLMNRGLQTMLLFFGSIFVASFIGFDQLMALVVPVVIFYSIFDTQQLTKDINAGIPVDDKQFFDLKKIPFTQSWIGYALIVIGGLALLQNIMPYFPFWMELRRIIPPVIIIGLGVSILYRNTKKQEKSE